MAISTPPSASSRTAGKRAERPDDTDGPPGPGRLARAVGSPTFVRLATLVVILGAWEAYGRAQETEATFAPFTAVILSLIAMLGDQQFWQAIGGTISTFVIGLALAVMLGVPLGILMGRYLIVGRSLDTYMRFLLALPMSTLVPVVIIGVGVGLAARIVVVFLFAFVDIAYNSYLGMRYPNNRRIEMARSFNLSEYQMLRYIVLPSALPSIFVGLRLGTGRALIGMVVSELLLVAVGIGLLIDQYQGRFQAANLLALTVIILTFGVGVVSFVQWLERRVLFWRREEAA